MADRELVRSEPAKSQNHRRSALQSRMGRSFRKVRNPSTSVLRMVDFDGRSRDRDSRKITQPPMVKKLRLPGGARMAAPAPAAVRTVARVAGVLSDDSVHDASSWPGPAPCQPHRRRNAVGPMIGRSGWPSLSGRRAAPGKRHRDRRPVESTGGT